MSKSKLVKVAVIIAIAAVVMAARQATLPGADKAASLATQSIAPMEMMRKTGPLPQTEIADYF